MLRFFTGYFVFFALSGCSSIENTSEINQKNIYQFVDPIIGTGISTTESALKHSEAGSEQKGQTFPAVGVPHGMTHWTPQTRATENKCLSPYYYEEEAIQGFRGSHWMSGSCTQDYGSVTIMPISGNLAITPENRASAFSHSKESASPAYYSVDLDDYQILAELTAGTRAGFLRFTFNRGEDAFVVIEPNSDEGEAYVEIDPEKREITGYNPVHRIYQGWGKPAGFSGHFVIQFDQAFEDFGIWKDSTLQQRNFKIEGNKNNIGAFVKWQMKSGGVVNIKVGTSFTSLDNARKNLMAEIPEWDFQALKNSSEEIWEEALSRIKVTGGTEADKIKFYTALYHTKIIPRLFNDADGSYPGFADDDNIHTAEDFDYYEDFSLWDTFRALHPLLTLLEPVRTEHMVKSLLKKAEQGGWLPIFPCWNHYTSAMIGDHAISMIGDAFLKGIDNFDQEFAYKVMHKNAFQPNTDVEDYREGKGRRAMDSYLKYGFIPLEDSVWDSFHKREQVSRTLEYAYDDYVLSQVAQKLGKNNDYDQLIHRAGNYKHVFDTSTGFVRGKYADGSWVEDFDPFALRASFITEGSPFQYTWFVPHDVEGLINLMGGTERFINRLDTLFDQGHYWHGNEPGNQIVYMYPFAGAAWKTQDKVREIIKEEYGTGPGGLSGNEDSGQMSAWLVFSMMGFYPVTPGMPLYIIGSPVFDEISLQVGQGKTFNIKAKDNSEENQFIQSAKLNGQEFSRTYITHEEILEGGDFILIMGPKPNKNWGAAPENKPPSMSNHNFLHQ